MELLIENTTIKFEIIPVTIIQRDLQNIFLDNKKTLRYSLEKAIADKKNRLNKIASEHLTKYSTMLDLNLGEFLFRLKNESNSDYKLYLNKYGDRRYCIYKIDQFLNDKGIYCYVVDNKIKYLGRSRKTFKERFNEYGKITAYNCLIDGQATNCHINSIINSIENVFVGIYKMTNKSDEEIKEMEKRILKHKTFEWNIQKS
jgi:KaiC/GvpD/RAD55 family RecA-like ATPase